MKKKQMLFVANWKTELSIQETINYCKQHGRELGSITQHTGNSIALCPTTPALALVWPHLKKTGIKLGAQNCSPYAQGPYTGEVTAASLKELDCTYCIIGHSERRRLFHESNAIIAQKGAQALDAQLTPILCIGQQDPNSSATETISILERQLLPLKKILKHGIAKQIKVLIAYEPIGAIGTGKVPTPNFLQEIYAQLNKYVVQWDLNNIQVKFLYGGSVSEDTIDHMAHIEHLEGFLIGRASLDFQKFKNMITLYS